jgi:hypothetical protein
MQAAAEGGFPGLSGEQNAGHRSMVSELVSLIEHVQAGVKQLEAVIARESAPGNHDAASNVFVLDDVTPRYVRANAALNACNASLGMALHYLLDTREAKHETGDFTASDRRPVRLTNRG